MNIKEVSEALGIAESTLKNNYKRTAESLLKKGIILNKKGRGISADYTIEYDMSFKDNRALTIFDENKEIYLQDDMLKMIDWNLLVLVGICLTPLLTFRGSYKDFLNYVGVLPSAANINKLKEVLVEMDADYIGYYPDKTDEQYFTASLYRSVEKKYKVSIIKLRKCKEIQEKYHGRSFIPLLKTWLATEEAVKNQPYTIDDLIELTGLSKSTIVKANRQLRDENVYRSEKDYIPEMKICRGVNTDINGFFDEITTDLPKK